MSDETRYDGATVELVARNLSPENWPIMSNKQRTQQRTYARRAVDALADAGLLMPPGARVEEYAQLMSGGGFHVRNGHPEIDRIFPLDDWIEANTRGGGRVFRRVITVVEDWVEVTE